MRLILCLCLLVAAVAAQTESKPIVIGRWDGDGIRETESFSAPRRECQILWNAKAGESGSMIFQIYVYEDDGSLVSVAANTMREGKGYTDIRLDPKKKYYLQINSTAAWSVVIGAK